MERNKLWSLILLVSWLLLSFQSFSQHRFMVFFQDKNSDFSIDNPEGFLSERAIQRRARQGIEITEQDLPVNNSYIASLKDQDVVVWYTTKWLNGALIETDSLKLTNIMALPFILAVEFVAPGPLQTRAHHSNGKSNNFQQGRVLSTVVQNRILGIDIMQQEGITGEGILIAVFDGGFIGVDQSSSFAHLVQNGQLITSFDFVGNSSNVFQYDDHGTKVLSVIGANNPPVFTGSAFDADFILCVTEDLSSEFRVEEYNWLFAAEMADSAGVDIINTSLGYSVFDDPDMTYSVEELDGMTTAVSRAATIAASKGMVLTISAGNEGNSPWQTLTAPADVSNALAVGAINEDTAMASFSSTGPTADGRIKPDVVALGVNTAVINGNGNVVFNNGTSFSAPQIAGLAAGVWQSNPNYNYLEVIETIRQAGHNFHNADNLTGFGIPHFDNTREMVLAVEDPADNTFIQIYPNPMGNRLYAVSEVPLETVTFFIHNVSGQMLLENQMTFVPANTEVYMDIPLLSSGVYLLTVLSQNWSENFRLIRQ